METLISKLKYLLKDIIFASRLVFEKCHFCWEWLSTLLTVVNKVVIVVFGLNMIPHIGQSFVTVAVANAAISNFAHRILHHKLFQIIRTLNVFICSKAISVV